ncbi:MAG: ribosome maturation factor RimP [Beutenbergiaceae bacterium]
MTDLANQLHKVLDPVVAGAGLYLEEVTVTGPVKQPVVQVVVDLPDGPGGVDSDQLAEVSRLVSHVLDEADQAPPGAYLLEVSTPGIQRPLTQARHFRRAQGRLVRLDTNSGPMAGRVVGVDAEQLVLDVEHPRGEATRTQVRLADITVGRIEVELRRSAQAE